MGFINLAARGDNHFLKYASTLFLVVLSFVSIGQLPLYILFALRNKEAESATDFSDILNVLSKNEAFISVLFPFTVALIALILGVMYWHKRSFLSLVTNRSKFDFRRFGFSFLLWFSVCLLFLGFKFFTEQTLEFQFHIVPFIGLFLAALILIPIQTLFEEVLFRGYLMQSLKRRVPKNWIIILVSSIAFGFLHGSNPEVRTIGGSILIYYIVSGLFLSILATMDDGIELSWGYHTANNLFASLMVTNSWQSFQTDAFFIDHSKPSFGIESILTLVVFQPLLIVVFSKVYKWKSWKNKIFNE